MPSPDPTAPTPPERAALIAEAEARHQRNRASFRMDTRGGVPQLPGPLSDNDLYVAAMADVPALLAQVRADADEIARLRTTLEDIASGELGINVSIKHARRALEAPDA